MSERRRVAVMFELDGAARDVRERVRGIHQWAEEHPGRWTLVHDPYAREHLGDYDGILGPGGRPIAKETRAAGVPFVAATTHAVNVRMQRVCENRRQGGVLAARHLIECGYQRFGFLGHNNNLASSLLEGGFKYTVSRRGFGCIIHVHARRQRRRAATWARFRGHVADLLDEVGTPAGILAATDVLALHLAEECARKGLAMPHDVGIVGAGDDPAVWGGAPLPLSSLSFPCDEVGYDAARLLEHLMRGGAPRWRTVYLRPTLVARASTRREFFNDAAVADALNWIARHAYKPMRVADVAAAVGVPARTLLRRFQRTRHRTIAQEITRARLHHAEDLLQATEASVDAIARAVGFARGAHLHRVFRAFHGTTPGAWRRGRPLPPWVDPTDYGRAKHLIEHTRLTVGTIAAMTGFGRARDLRLAFVTRERRFPGEYRVEHWKAHPHATEPRHGEPDYQIVIHHDGPRDGPDDGVTAEQEWARLVEENTKAETPA